MKKTNNINQKILIKNKIYLGNNKIKTNRNLEEFLFCETNNKHILNINYTQQQLKKVLHLIQKIIIKNQKILFIGKKEYTKIIIKKTAQLCEQLYINNKWTGGFLTNWNNINGHTFDKKPQVIILLDNTDNQMIINEAKQLNIPIIAIIDNTNTQINNIDYPIIGNTNSIKALCFYCLLIIKTITKNAQFKKIN